MRRGLATLISLALLVSTTLMADPAASTTAKEQGPLYTVQDGPTQEGLVGPSLIESFKTITKERFHEQLMKGNPEKGMPPFATSDMINKNWEYLYAYLKGRSDGKIQPGHLYPIEEQK